MKKLPGCCKSRTMAMKAWGCWQKINYLLCFFSSFTFLGRLFSLFVFVSLCLCLCSSSFMFSCVVHPPVLLVCSKFPLVCGLSLGFFFVPLSSVSPSLVFFLLSPLVCSLLWLFIKPYDGLCSCVRASRSWGTNASVSLRRNKGITVLLMWPLEDNGQLRPKMVLVSCWIGPWSGDEEGDEQWFKTSRLYLEMIIFNLAPECLTFNN